MRDYSMIDRLEATLKRYNEIGEELSSPEIISDIKLPEFTDDEKNRIIESYQNWGEYGWTIFPFVKYNFYNSCPDNLIEADKKVLKECNKHNLSLLFERLNDFELINKKYYRYLDDEKGVKKVKNALVRYGYSYEDINAVLNEILNESDG